MSKLTYVLANATNGPVSAGPVVIQPQSSKTVTVESDSADDVAISAAVAAGSLSVTSVSYSSPLQSPERRVELAQTSQNITYAATVTPDLSLGCNLNIGTLTGGITIGAPTVPSGTSLFVGQTITFFFTQDATGGRAITWNAIFKKAADGAGTANQVGLTTFRWNGSAWLQDGGALTFRT